MARIGYSGIADAKPPQHASDGPHELRISNAKYRKNKGNDRYSTEVLIEVLDQEVLPIYHYLGVPEDVESYIARRTDLDEKQAIEKHEKMEKAKAYSSKQFLHTFGISFDEEGYDTDDFFGKTATAETKQEVDDQNRRRTNLVLPMVLD